MLVIGLLLGAVPAGASNGGDSSVGRFCLEPGGRRIFYFLSDGGESGCYDTLYALDVRTGRSTVAVVMECDSKEGSERQQKLVRGCTPLVSVSTLGLEATIVSRGGAPTFINPPDDPNEYHFVERSTYAQRLELSRNGAPVGGLDFGSCVFSSGPKLAWVTLLGLPKKPFGLLKVTHPGVCYETGYLKDEVVLLPSLFGATGAQASQPDTVAVALKPPDVGYPEIYLKVSKQLERANKHTAAERYRQEADKNHQRALSRALESGVLDANSGRFYARGTSIELKPGEQAKMNDCLTTACATRPVDGAPLQSESLDALGMTATIRSTGKPQATQPTGKLHDFNVGCPQKLVLTRNGAPLAVHAFTSDCPLIGPARLVAWPVPQRKLTVFMLTETRNGPGELFAVATPGVKPSSRTVLAEAESWIPLDLPPVDLSRSLNDAGMALYRKGRFDDAAAHFAKAWTRSANRQPRLFIALYNHAATLGRLGRADQSLGVLRELLSFSDERERFIKKVRSDDDFASLRSDARLDALLEDPNCCVEAYSSGKPETGRGRVRWTNGKQTVLQQLAFYKGKKVSEFDADGGFDRAWYESGQLRSEAVFVRGEKSGASRTWDEAGHLLSETTYVDGVKSGLQRTWSSTGQLLSETPFEESLKSGLERTWSSTGQLLSEITFQDDAKTGPQRTWFSSGKPQTDYQFVKGRISGPYNTWYESGQPETEARVADGGPGPRPRRETLQHRGWSAAGQLIFESWTVGGVSNGTRREWYESGQLKSEARYEKGVKRGQTHTWAEDGGVAPTHDQP